MKTRPASAPSTPNPVSRAHRRALVAVVATVLSLLAAACGIPTEETVEALPQTGHEELLDGTTSTTEEPPELVNEDVKIVSLYFIGIDSKLEVVERPLARPVTGSALLGVLEAGPTTEERNAFAEVGILTTLLPSGLNGQFTESNPETGVQPVLVDPAAELRLLDDDTRRIIVSQIVCTVLLLRQPGIFGVEIFDGEEPIPLTDNNAEPIEGPAELEDFNGCQTGTEERAELATTTSEAG